MSRYFSPARGRRCSTVRGRFEGHFGGFHPTELPARARRPGNGASFRRGCPARIFSGGSAPVRAGHERSQDAPFPGRATGIDVWPRSVSVKRPCLRHTGCVCSGLFYRAMAGLVALGALRTAPRYGYGTQFLLEQDRPMNEILAESLARQEIVNIVRHLRNEAAFQSLRNGLLLFIIVIVMFTGIFVFRLLSALSSRIF